MDFAQPLIQDIQKEFKMVPYEKPKYIDLHIESLRALTLIAQRGINQIAKCNPKGVEHKGVKHGISITSEKTGLR